MKREKPVAVHLRKKKLKEKISLYLDFSRNVWHEEKGIFTRRDYLGLYLYDKPRSEAKREHNRQTLAEAEAEKARVILELKNKTYGIIESTDEKQKRINETDFIAFFRERAETRKDGTKANWLSYLNYFIKFTGGKCAVKNITRSFVIGYKEFCVSGLGLSPNTASAVFNTFKTLLKEAVLYDLLTQDFREVSNIPKVQTKQPFFTFDEIRRMNETEYPANSLVKPLAMFCALTGLRFSDAAKVRKKNFVIDADGVSLEYRQQKTGKLESLPVSIEALELCNLERLNADDVCFPIKYTTFYFHLPKFFEAAGIEAEKAKKAKSHAFRRSFATELLAQKAHLQTISKLLGHSTIKTTEIYLNVQTEAKREAVSGLSLKPKQAEKRAEKTTDA